MNWRDYSAFARWFIVVVALLALVAVPVAAQVASGALTGTVTDPTGAVIPGADVKVTNVATGNVRMGKTNATGDYRFNDLPLAGTYKLEVTAEGFKTSVQTGIKLTVGTITRSDVKMELGARAEVVTVEAAPPVVQTDDARLMNTVTSDQIESLPLNGRNVYDLMQLTAGAADVTGTMFENGHDTVVNGTRESFTGFLINGVSNKGLSGGINAVPNADLVAEFQQLTLNDSAQYGSSAGSINNLVTKSGTNEFHGSMYYFHRNEALDANQFFLNQQNTPKQPLNFNQFGVTATGPVVKDKLFFTASYQGERFITSAPAIPIMVESQDWRSAVEGAYPNSVAALLYNDFGPAQPGSPLLTIDQYITQGFSATGFTSYAEYLCPDTVGRASLANQFAQMFGVTAQDQADMATLGCSIIQPLQAGLISRNLPFMNITSATPQQQTSTNGNLFDGNEWSTRLDWQANENNRLFGEFYWERNNDRFGPGNVTASRGFFNPQQIATPHFNTSWVSTIRPTVVNELRAGYTRNRNEIGTALPGVPSIYFYDGSLGMGSYNGYPQFFTENVYNYSDMLSITKGSHNLKMGAEFRRNLENSEFNVGRPSYYFWDQFFFALDSPWAEIVGVDPGFASGQPAQLASNVRYWRNLEMGFFFQDDWKVNRKLTINMGIRYDLYTRHTEKQHRVTTFILPPGTSLPNQIAAANIPAGQPGCNTPTQIAQAQLANVCGPGGFAVAGTLGQGDHNNWGPRFGIAWDPWGNGKTAIRAGFGVSYEGTLYNPLSNSRWNLPFYSFNLLFNDIGGGTNSVIYGPTSTDPAAIACPSNGSAPSYTSGGNNCGQPAGGPLAAGNIQGYDPTNPNTAFLTGIVFPQGIRDPYVFNTHVGFQHEFLPDTVLEVNWVRTRGHKLFRAQQANRLPGDSMNAGVTYVDRLGRTLTGLGSRYLNPNYGVLRVWQNVTESWYDGLQITVRKAMSHGFMFNGNYTWSHSLDTGSDWHSGATSANGSAAGDGYSLDQTAVFLDKGNSTYDIRHRAVFTFLWDTPWHKDMQGAKGQLLGGWSFQGTLSAQSGAHWTPYCTSSYSGGCDFNADGERNDRPDITTSNTMSGNTDMYANGYFFNGGCAFSTTGTCADGSQPFFVNPCFGQIGTCAENGNLGRNTFVGPTHWNADFAIHKDIRVKENIKFEFRFETFNLFNHTNFLLPSSSTGANYANRITVGTFGASAGTLDPRTIQLGLKLIW